VIIRTRAGLVAKGTLCEASLSGARLIVTVCLPVHSVILIQFADSGSRTSRMRVALEAQIVRKTDTGIAVEWSEFAPEAVRDLWRSQEPDLEALRRVGDVQRRR
jgi:hypothetical protein